jgi:hypothetical protein
MAGIESNIIFRIGSKLGPGGFASLKAGIDMLGSMLKNVKDNIKELDQFAQAWQRANKQAVLMADTAAAGLIDTGAIIKQHNALMRSGVKLTDEQFKTIAVRTVELAQATGEDATAAFERLTKSIQTGSTRALREYGVDLKTSGTLTDRQTEAVDKLTDGFGGMTVSVENTSERLFVLKNNVGTLATILWSSSGSNDTLAFALDEVNGSLATFNEEMAAAPAAMEKFIRSGDALKGFVIEMKSRGVEIIQFVMDIFKRGFEAVARSAERFASIPLPFISAPMRGIQGAAEALSKGFDINIKIAEKKREQFAEESRKFWEDFRRDANRETVTPPGGPRGIREVGGAGGAAGPGFDPGQGFLEADLEEQRVREEFWTEQRNKKLEADRLAKDQERELEFQRIQESTEWQTEYFAFLEEEENKRLDRMSFGFFADKKTMQATEMMWKKSLQSRAQMMGGFFGIIGQLQQSENEKAWRIGKAANIAKTAIDTYTAAIAAYKSMAGIPYVGPALGAAAAVAVTAMGLQAIRNIKATNFTDQGQPGFVPETAAATGGFGGNAIGAHNFAGVPGGSTQTIRELGQQDINVNITMKDEGAGLFDVVMTQNENASKDGRTSLMTSAR